MSYWSSEKRAEIVPIDRSLVDPLLRGLLKICSPHNHEHHVANAVRSLDYVKKHTIEELEGGNLLVTVGTNPTSMFSCHMDIVGSVSKKNSDRGNYDEIVLMTDKPKKKDQDKKDWSGWIYGSKWYLDKGRIKFIDSTLGADDKVGVYLLLKMIEKEIPGIYVFHVGEEVGGVGSQALVKNQGYRFKDIKRAIAFDRAGYNDVICFQRGGRCCSKEFGQALASQLNLYMPPKEKYSSEITGTFTDTANYREIVPECTNISVGYFNQHGHTEKLDYFFLQSILLPAILQVDYDTLPTVRDPKEKPVYTPHTYTSTYKYNSSEKSLNRKTWKEADENTMFMDLPLWQIKDGFVKDAKPEVLEKAIRNFLLNANFNDKDEFVKTYIWNLEYNEILEDELEVHQRQLIMLANKKEHGNIEDISIGTKKRFLRELLVEAKGIAIIATADPESSNYDANGITQYCSNVEKFLEEIKEKVIEDDYSKKEFKKLNRYIFTMAYCLSLEEPTTEERAKLLVDIQRFIEKNVNEEGFDGDPKMLFGKPKKLTDANPTVH